MPFGISKPKWKPRIIQRKGIKWLLEHAGAGLLFDPGVGKTTTVLAAIKILNNEGMLDRVLIVAPLRVVYSVWPGEIEKWADFKDLTYGVLHGKNKEKVLASDVQILLINPEGLAWLFAHKKWKTFKFTSLLVVDESTKFKNTSTQRFKLLRPVLKFFARRWILTGTPAPNGLLDLFGQIFIVDLGRSLGEYITHYRNKFFDGIGFGGHTWVLREGSDKLITKAIKPYVLRAAAEDFIDIPDVLEVNIMVELPPKARKVYDDLEEELFSMLSDGTSVSAINKSAVTGKCRQICGGSLYVNEEVKSLVKSDRYIELHAEKLDACVDLLEQRQGKPLLIVYEFKHELERLQKRLKAEGYGAVPYIGGGVTAKRGDELARQWNAGELPALFVHGASVSHGLNLQGCAEADGIFWYTTTWDYEVYDQLIRRLRRQGSKAKQIFVYRCLASDTVDLAVLRSVNDKRNTQDTLLSSLQRYRSKRLGVK
jgi:SNF2 family DNA or RNA helicase